MGTSWDFEKSVQLVTTRFAADGATKEDARKPFLSCQDYMTR